jgi:protein-S-isoprenylcysteine O-methyltransferase Ste14
VDEHETDTGAVTDRAWAVHALRNLLRTAWRVGVGVVAVGYLALAPLAALLIGVRVLGGTTVAESVLVVGGLLVVTVGYWGLVWWAEERGLADWAASGRASTDDGRLVASDGDD